MCARVLPCPQCSHTLFILLDSATKHQRCVDTITPSRSTTTPLASCCISCCLVTCRIMTKFQRVTLTSGQRFLKKRRVCECEAHQSTALVSHLLSLVRCRVRIVAEGSSQANDWCSSAVFTVDASCSVAITWAATTARSPVVIDHVSRRFSIPPRSRPVPEEVKRKHAVNLSGATLF